MGHESAVNVQIEKITIFVVRDVCPSVQQLSVEVISFGGNLISIDPKIGLDVR